MIHGSRKWSRNRIIVKRLLVARYYLSEKYSLGKNEYEDDADLFFFIIRGFTLKILSCTHTQSVDPETPVSCFCAMTMRQRFRWLVCYSFLFSRWKQHLNGKQFAVRHWIVSKKRRVRKLFRTVDWTFGPAPVLIEKISNRLECVIKAKISMVFVKKFRLFKFTVENK